jgi:pilus assembly protein Flp/PilA
VQVGRSLLRASRRLSSSEQDGQGLVEYGLILVLIALLVVVIMLVLGNQVYNVYCNISGSFK